MDVIYFAENWLWDISQQDGAFAQTQSTSMQRSFSGEDNTIASALDTLIISEQEIMPSIYLIADNYSPSPDQEVTVYVYSETPLDLMDIWATVNGNAEVNSAMNISDCNQYGWDPSWQMDSYFDTDGLVYIGGVAWPDQTVETVGYFKFRYYGGQVSVSIDPEFSDAFDSNSEPILFSAEPLIIGYE